MGHPPDAGMCASVSGMTSEHLLDVVGQRQFTAVSDGGHTNLSKDCILSDPDFMSGLTAKGVKHIFMEVDKAMQPDLDAFYRGDLDAAELHKRMGSSTALDPRERIAERNMEEAFFENSKAAGIRVHFVDPEPAVVRDQPERHGVYQQIEKKIMSGELHDEHDVSAFLSGTGFTLDGMKDHQRILAQQRVEANSEIAASIRQKSGVDKALIVYGSTHLDDENTGLPAQLGKDKTVVVELKTPDSVGGAAPHYTLQVDTGALSRTLQGFIGGLPTASALEQAETASPRAPPKPQNSFMP